MILIFIWFFFPAVEEEKTCDIVGGFDYLESPVSDGTIEENFEEELVNAPVSSYNSIYSFRDNDDDDEDFSDVSQYGIVEVVGDDAYGRKIITVTACKLPNSSQLDHQRLLRYLQRDKFYFLSSFKMDYTLQRASHYVVCFDKRLRLFVGFSQIDMFGNFQSTRNVDYFLSDVK